VVCIRVPKTRRRAARLQSVVIRARWAVKLITAALCGVPRDVALCAGGSLGLRQRFRALVCGLRLPPETYTPGSLRPGGAIAHHLAHNDLGRLLFHGRWDSVKTVQHYLHEGVAVSVAAQIEPAAAKLVLAVSRLLDELIDEFVAGVPAALRWEWPAGSAPLWRARGVSARALPAPACRLRRRARAPYPRPPAPAPRHRNNFVAVQFLLFDALECKLGRLHLVRQV